MNATPFYRILVIDDTPAIHDDFRKILTSPEPGSSQELASLSNAIFGTPAPAAPAPQQFDVASAFQGEEGLRLVREAVAADRPFTLAFVDMRMPPGWDGLETIAQLWRVDPNLQIVICTAYSDHSWSSIHQKLGRTTNLLVLKKPFDHIEVFQLAHSLGEKWQLNRRLTQQLSDLDLVARKRSLELARAEERFRQAFDASPLPQVIQTLAAGRVIETNSAYERLVGRKRDEIVGLTPEDFGHGLDPAAWRALLDQLGQGKPVDDFAVAITGPAGRPLELRCSGRAVEISGQPCGIWVIRDVTDQLLVEQQLRQSQKLEAIGHLAAGVAHDFNNLLTVILNYTSGALEEPTLPQAIRDNLVQVRAAGDRAAALTRQLLVFSRQQIATPEPLDLSSTVLNLREMLTRLIPARIKLEWDCPSGLPILLADAANVEQVLLNLVVNARDATPREGRIAISVSTHEFTPADLTALNPARVPGSFLRLAVEDTGVGIPSHILPRIFDPFFTTKEVGHGTGLGLATVYSIAHQHHGWVEVASNVGRGTRFEVYFHRTADVTLPLQAAVAPAQHSPAESPRILYVEDDAAVRLVTQSILSKLARSLAVASDGPTAQALWRSTGGKFDLLITDMVMPNGPNGADLAAQFTSENPQLKVLVTSGYSAKLLTQSEGLPGSRRVLTKPYGREELLQSIRSTLAET